MAFSDIYILFCSSGGFVKQSEYLLEPDDTTLGYVACK